MSTSPITTTVRIDLADAQPGDMVWQAGEWRPVSAFHLFGSSVKLVWPNGSTHAMPQSHCPTITRTLDASAVGTHVLGAHLHHIDGADTLCSELTHCPSLCTCPVDGCTAELVTA